MPNNDSNWQSEHIAKCKEGQEDKSVENTKGVTSSEEVFSPDDLEEECADLGNDDDGVDYAIAG